MANMAQKRLSSEHWPNKCTHQVRIGLQIMCENHNFKTFCDHQRVKIWPTGPKISDPYTLFIIYIIAAIQVIKKAVSRRHTYTKVGVVMLVCWMI